MTDPPKKPDPPALAIFAMDELADIIRARFPEEPGTTLEIVKRLLTSIPPGKGAIVYCDVTACGLPAQHRVCYERATHALHLKSDGKPVPTNNPYSHGERGSASVCVGHREATREHFTAKLYSVSVTDIKKE